MWRKRPIQIEQENRHKKYLIEVKIHIKNGYIYHKQLIVGEYFLEHF